jgi:gamma-glutamyl hercynylcysteine S-oxide synthase
MDEPLDDWVRDARARTHALAEGLAAADLLGPRLAIVNPPLWELGHVAWFQERWLLRREGAPPRLDGADALYDSAAVPHDVRWDLPLPSLERTLAYLDAVEDAVRARLGRAASEDDGYFVRLAIFHEDMHGEAMLFSRQTLGLPPPAFPAGPPPAAGACGARGEDLAVAGGTFRLGAEPGGGFVFDNEKWAHRVELAPFSIARTPVTQGDLAAFVEDGGYARAALWTAEGWRWRQAAGVDRPAYWTRAGVGWARRAFDRVAPLELDRPAVNVSRHEADAWCRWAGRRLPSEAEWEAAAAAPELGPSLGAVWEWTASTFLPYPGFAPDPYREYSQPWFGTHEVLRGGSFATPARLLRRTFRNFYEPHRRDPWAGFRTCAA